MISCSHWGMFWWPPYSQEVMIYPDGQNGYWFSIIHPPAAKNNSWYSVNERASS